MRRVKTPMPWKVRRSRQRRDNHIPLLKRALMKALGPKENPMEKTVKYGEIPQSVQAQIVARALDAAFSACQMGASTEAAADAERVARAGVAAWQIANGKEAGFDVVETATGQVNVRPGGSAVDANDRL